MRQENLVTVKPSGDHHLFFSASTLVHSQLRCGFCLRKSMFSLKARLQSLPLISHLPSSSLEDRQIKTLLLETVRHGRNAFQANVVVRKIHHLGVPWTPHELLEAWSDANAAEWRWQFWHQGLLKMGCTPPRLGLPPIPPSRPWKMVETDGHRPTPSDGRLLHWQTYELSEFSWIIPQIATEGTRWVKLLVLWRTTWIKKIK